LILPSTVTKIFQTFSCRDVDPEDSVQGSDSYMTADYSVSCDSQKYHFGYIWAIVMIFVYPIGLPMYYFYLLWNIRDAIKSRDEKVNLDRIDDSVDLSDEVRMKQEKLLSLKFLYGSYHPHYWWWEMVETSQRLLLTGILVLISQGSAIQIIVGALLTLFFLQLYDKCEPFSDKLILSIKIVSSWQIYFVFWIALLIKADFPSISLHHLGICLVFTVFGNFMYDFGKFIWIAINHKSSELTEMKSMNRFSIPSIAETEMGRVVSLEKSSIVSVSPIHSLRMISGTPNSIHLSTLTESFEDESEL
jgi:hypothetical protein